MKVGSLVFCLLMISGIARAEVPGLILFPEKSVVDVELQQTVKQELSVRCAQAFERSPGIVVGENVEEIRVDSGIVDYQYTLIVQVGDSEIIIQLIDYQISNPLVGRSVDFEILYFTGDVCN